MFSVAKTSLSFAPPVAAVLLALTGSPALAQAPELRIVNAPPELERNIAALVSLPNQACDVQPAALRRFLPAIRDQVIRAGRALGYYNLVQQTEFVRGDNCWHLQTTLEPGPPVTIANVSVSLASSAELFEETLDNLPVATGDQLNHALYERSKSEISARAIELGFFAARFNRSELRLDLQNNTANVDIEFVPGPRYLFGEVEIEPVPALSEEFVRRYISFASDAYYSASALIELRNSLSDSFYFSNVTVTPALEQVENQRVPIRVGLDLRPRHVYSAGVGMTTDIGPRVRLDYEDRYLNEQGHRFEARSAASPIRQLVDLSYVVPWTNPATERLTFSGGFLHEDNDTFTLETTKFGANYGHINPWGWRQNYFLNFQHDISSIGEIDQVSDMLIPGTNVSRVRADDALYPTEGWSLFAQISGASDTLFSTETFVQLDLRGKLIYTLGPGRIIAKFETGTIITDDIEALPASLQYFTGGDQSVRGYRYRSLGPLEDADDEDLVGGKHLLVAGIEYDFNILPAWKLAIFADAGNAFNDLTSYELKKSVGLGVRWMSPLGPIRVDLASALDNDNKLRLHITMGPDL